MNESELAKLVKAGTVRSIEVRRTGKSDRHAFAVYVNDEPLASARLEVRGFGSVDTASRALEELGVEVSTWRAVMDERPARKRRRK